MIEITRDMILNANDYIPLMRKYEIAENVAKICIVPVSLSLDDEAFPDRYQENEVMVKMVLMGLFATLYLKQDFGLSGDDYQLPAPDYDEWEGSHVFNQMERFKADKELKEKIFDLLYDFKMLQMMVNHAIASLLGHKNDTVARLAQWLKQSASLLPSDLEALSKVKEELEKVKGEVQHGG